MTAPRAIQILNEAAYKHTLSLDADFYQAAALGAKALILLTQDKTHQLDDQSQRLLLGLET